MLDLTAGSMTTIIKECIVITDKNSVGGGMFYGNPDNRIVHYDDCEHVKKAKASVSFDMEAFHTLEEARLKGYTLCRHCDPIMRRFKHEEPDIKKLCIEHDIYYRLSNGEFEVITKESRWKVCISKGRHLRLYHQNKCGSKYNRTQFHIQDYNVTTACRLLDYIVKHDEYTQSEFSQFKCRSPKGSKKYIKAMKAEKERKKKGEIKYVLNLIEAVSEGSYKKKGF